MAIPMLLIITIIFSPFLDVVHSRKPPKPDGFIGPTGVEHSEMTTCEEFAQHAKFNPYSVTGVKWFAFYYWAPTNENMYLSFFVPTNKEIYWLKMFYEDHPVTVPIEWSSRLLIMKDQKDNQTYLLVEVDKNHGLWDNYAIVKPTTTGEKIDPIRFVFKQTSDNRYLGFMMCEENMVFVLSRMNDIPAKKQIQDAAATMRYRARMGKSYLYQGHQWMPIPEDDDKTYWLGREFGKRKAFDYFFHDTPGW